MLLTLSFSSCEKQKTNLQLDIEFSYVDLNGKDLLDPANPNGYKESDINLYYLIGGVKTHVVPGMLNFPGNFRIYLNEAYHKYSLSIFANDRYDANKMSETLIDFGNRVDTVSVSWNVYNNGYSVHGVWYNHVLKAADYYSTSTGLITITVE